MNILTAFERASTAQSFKPVSYGTAAAFRRAADDLSSLSSPMTTAFNAAAPAMAAAPQSRSGIAQDKSLLQSLAPNLNTKAPVASPVQNLRASDQTKGLTGGTVAGSQQILGGVQADVKNIKAGITGTIQQAQNEIFAATKAAGLDAGQVFPDRQMAATGTAGLLGHVAMAQVGVLPGGQAVAGFAQHGATMDLVLSDRAGAGLGKKEALSRIADQLRAQSVPPLPHPVASAVSLIESPKTRFDWNGFLDTHDVEGLEKIMAIDPKNPSPALVPEYAALDALDHDTALVLSDNQDIQDALDALRMGLYGAQESLPALNMSLSAAQAMPVDKGAEAVLAVLAPKAAPAPEAEDPDPYKLSSAFSGPSRMVA